MADSTDENQKMSEEEKQKLRKISRLLVELYEMEDEYLASLKEEEDADEN